MRKNIRVCGVDFDIELIEGGKLRSKAPKEPGFEFVGASLRELRDNIPAALGEWDKRPKIAVDVGTQDAAIYSQPAPQVTPYNLRPVGQRIAPKPPNPMDYPTYDDYMRDMKIWNSQQQAHQQKLKDLAIDSFGKSGGHLTGY